MEGDSEKIAQLLRSGYETAPPYIRTYIDAGKLDAFMETETGKYKLPLDIADKVSNELLLMLLGFSPPDQMFDQFVDIEGLDLDIIPDLLDDINKEILLPLRDSLNATAASAEPNPPVSVPAPKPEVPRVPPPIPAPGPAARPVPAPPARPPSTPSPSAVPGRAEIHTAMRTMAGDMQAMQEHPEQVPHPVPPVIPPSPAAPVPAAPAQSTPSPVNPPQPEPSPQPARTVPPPPNLPGAPIIKEYGVDPYREPVE